MNKLPCIKEHFSDWYNELVFKSELVEDTPIRGCIIMRPYSYAIWEKIQKLLDGDIKAMGAQNAAFPLFIPYSFIEKEKDHIDGFAPEVAVVTHAGGKKIEEPLVVRPTSEVIIHSSFSRWIKSWRDLPIKINQWCNVIRWEKRPRPFIRTTEFWWQEGHTAHETCQEAYDQAYEARILYENFIRECLSIPVISGEKPAHERFAGAQATFTLESMMQDGKALQMGTSHILGKGFAESFDIKFLNRDGGLSIPFLTSWGVTTRLIGAMIMVHGDQKGLVIPPKLAPIQFIIIPIVKKKDSNDMVLSIENAAKNLKTILSKNYSVKIDDDYTETPGSKFYKYELKGIPFRIEIGAQDIEKNSFVLTRRDNGLKESINMKSLEEIDSFLKDIEKKIEIFHKDIYKKAEKYLYERTFYTEDIKIFGPKLMKDAGFYITKMCSDSDCLEVIKSYTATVRCIVENDENELLKKDFCCIHGEACKNDKKKVIIAKAY